MGAGGSARPGQPVRTHQTTSHPSHPSRSPCCSDAQSFHFADKLPAESFQASIARHEYYLALKLGLKVAPLHRSARLGVPNQLTLA